MNEEGIKWYSWLCLPEVSSKSLVFDLFTATRSINLLIPGCSGDDSARWHPCIICRSMIWYPNPTFDSSFFDSIIYLLFIGRIEKGFRIHLSLSLSILLIPESLSQTLDPFRLRMAEDFSLWYRERIEIVYIWIFWRAVNSPIRMTYRRQERTGPNELNMNRFERVG